MTVTIPSMQDLLEAGVHFGHQTRRCDPRMSEYLFGARGGVHIINLELSEKKLKEAAEFLYSLGKQGKVLLMVGTKKQAQIITQEAARKIGTPYVNFRWIGGLLTNFDEVRRNINRLIELRGLQEKSELARYTKKERLLISRRLDKFDLMWGGVSEMQALPDAIFVTDAVAEKTAIMEANRIKIPVVAIADSNSNPLIIGYPIPGNDDATKSLKILIEAVAGAYEQGLKEREKQSRVNGLQAMAEDKKSIDGSQSTVNTPVADQVAVAEEEIEKKEIVESARKE